MRIPTLTLVATTLVLSGCSFLQGKEIDYKSAGTRPSLEVPPDLLAPSADGRYAIPGTVQGSATYSDYSQERGARPAASNATVLPTVDKARIERAGSQRWLVVDLPPAEVWPVLKDFWQELGFLVNVDTPEAGVMETDWAENRAKIPQDGLRSLLGKVIDGLYSTGERDRFRTRVESSGAGGTEIYISHRGMIEVFEGTQGGGDQGRGRTLWQPRAPDPELEAEMLRRLMLRFGIENDRAQTLLARQASEPRAITGYTADKAPGVLMEDAFDRAWRRVGLALDRIGFVVEDRDRAQGIYYVRYADPEAGARKDTGWVAKLAFWRGNDKTDQALKYQVRVIDKGDAGAVAAVYLEDGSPADNETGKRIARLLHEQLK